MESSVDKIVNRLSEIVLKVVLSFIIILEITF